MADQLNEWEQVPRGRLALILLYDQFPRIQHRWTAQAFQYDPKAQQLCLDGLLKKLINH